MTLVVYSIVKRHMKRTSPLAFTVFDGSSRPPIELPYPADESLIGWYRNPEPWRNSFILFSSQALYLVEGDVVDRISIDDIVGYELPKSKADVTGIRVLTKDGFRFARVAGSFGPHGNQKDAYSFLMVVKALTPARARDARDGGKVDGDA